MTATDLRYLMALRRRRAALAAKDDLLVFTKLLMPDPDQPDDVGKSAYSVALYHRAIAAALEQVEAGKISRLIVNAPPRHGKSQIASRMFPAWYAGRHPTDSIILATYSDKLSWDFGREIRQIMEDPIYRQVFPDMTLNTASVDRIETMDGGKLFCVGVGSAITGRGSVGLILDDLVKGRVEADSIATRKKIWEWFNQVAKTRLVSSVGWIVAINCLTGDALVSMADGSLKRMDEVVPGDRVVSWDGKKTVSGKVDAVIDNGINQTYLLRTKRTETRANARHPFLVLSAEGLKWVRMRDLRPGMRIVAHGGANTRAFRAQSRAATRQQNAGGCAAATTTKPSGLPDQNRLHPLHPRDRSTGVGGDMALMERPSTECLPSKAGSAPYAKLTGALEDLGIGSPTLSPIIITTPENCGAFCVTTATGSLDELEVPKFWDAPSNTSELVIDVTPCGTERVYDLTIADTHVFVANGLWTHNTRWHSDDLVGRLIDPLNPDYSPAEGRKWKIIDLPALALDDDVLGRKRGEALWPERFPVAYLEDMRAADPRGFQALYQGSPTLESGQFFSADKIKTYGRSERPPLDKLRFYAASDHAVSLAQARDKTCLMVVGIDEDSNIWVMEDLVWGRLSSNLAVERMIDLMAKYKPLHWWAEKGHISKSIGPFLRKRMLERGTFCGVAEVTAVHDKQTRAQSIRARIEMGMVYFPSFAPWWMEARQELLSFPHGVHDDVVDALAWVGYGLALHAPPKSARPKKPEPRSGSLAWVKSQSVADKKRRNAATQQGW